MVDGRRVPLGQALGDIQTSLGALTQGQADIGRRLDHINGSISTLYSKTEQNKEDLHAHERDCPAKEKVETLVTRIETGQHPGSQAVIQKVNGLETTLQQVKLGVEGLGQAIEQRDKLREKQSNKTWHRIVLPLINLIGSGIVLVVVHYVLKAMGK